MSLQRDAAITNCYLVLATTAVVGDCSCNQERRCEDGTFSPDKPLGQAKLIPWFSSISAREGGHY